MNMDQYLSSSKYIDFEHPEILGLAKKLKSQSICELELVKLCFEFVRDQIKHSWDYQLDTITCKASDALVHKTGFCFAKSHLLAALLRANNIPTGLCYQRLSVSGEGGPYCLHGLNAVYLNEYGWYRLDSRGNNREVNADFCPPEEKLAFPVLDQCEYDFPEIWPEPLPIVVSALESYNSISDYYDNLPDIECIPKNM